MCLWHCHTAYTNCKLYFSFKFLFSLLKILNLFKIKKKKNNSEISCNYEVEIDSKPNESLIFRGMSKFVVKSKDVFVYELSFLPTSEQKFEALLKLNNITEGIQYKYFLTGIGERRPPLGDLKLDTKVGQV